MEMSRLVGPCAIGLVIASMIGCGGASAPSSSTPATSSTTEGESTSPPAASSTEASKITEAAAAAPVEGGWGHLSGKFVFDGPLPTPAQLQITKDAEYCGDFGLVDERLVVNDQNDGLANVVIYLYVNRGANAPAVHESYAESASSAINLDNKGCRFEPHIALVRTTQTLHVINSDKVGHNTKIDTTDNTGANLTVPSGGSFDHQFTSSERRPAPVSCSIHPWMQSWLVVQDSPYAAVTNQDGEFEISNIPSGNWTFRVWHELGGNIDKVNVGGKSKTWSKGRVDVTINPDQTTDLGEVKIGADRFK